MWRISDQTRFSYLSIDDQISFNFGVYYKKKKKKKLHKHLCNENDVAFYDIFPQ